MLLVRSLFRPAFLSLLGLAFMLAAGAAVRADEDALADATKKWAPNVKKFEEQDQEKAPPQNPIVFIGSSSVTRWDVKKSFPDLPVLNRGYGGSTYFELRPYIDRIVTPYEPSVVVIYSGDNDLHRGFHGPKNAAAAFADFQEVVRLIRVNNPDVPLVILGVKTSESRWKIAGEMEKFNKLAAAAAADDPKMEFVDTDSPLRGEDGKPDPTNFVGDKLHLSPKGYAIWTPLVRAAIERALANSPTTEATAQ